MNNLEKLALSLSEQYSTQIKVSNSKDDSSAYEIRFSDLDEGTTFKFRLTRHLSSTSIRFVPDAYGLHAVQIIEEAIKEKLLIIRNFLNASSLRYSRMRFEIGDQSITDMEKNQESFDSGLIFEAKIFTEGSDFALGIFNEVELDLFGFAIELFLIFLRIKPNSYRNADEVLGYPEGATTVVLVNKYERNPKNRKLCIEYYGTTCLGCGFSFQENYGEIGQDFIIVHHVVPLSNLGPDYVIDPIKDLVPLCANCHAIVHRVDPPLSIEAIRNLTKYKSEFSS